MKCPYCNSDSNKHGKNLAGSQIYRCKSCRKYFVDSILSLARVERSKNPDTDSQRYCLKCKEYIDFDGFKFNRTHGSYESYCKACTRELVNKSRYDIDQHEIDEILLSQDHRCKICNVEFDESSRINTYRVDHDHDTGKVRGLLCNRCNRAIGMFGDDTDILAAAIAYLSD
jgi:hypothetical protein